MGKSRLGGCDNRTGKFVPLEKTRQDPKNTTREHIPLPGSGDTKKK